MRYLREEVGVYPRCHFVDGVLIGPHATDALSKPSRSSTCPPTLKRTLPTDILPTRSSYIVCQLLVRVRCSVWWERTVLERARLCRSWQEGYDGSCDLVWLVLELMCSYKSPS